MCNKAENALKGKLRRLCERKVDGKLKVPEWLHDEWRNGDHLAMAKQLEACNFDQVPRQKLFQESFSKQLFTPDRASNPPCRLDQAFSWQARFIKYKKKTVTKNDRHVSDLAKGWYTKEDMSKILKWNANLVSKNIPMIYARHWFQHMGLRHACNNVHFSFETNLVPLPNLPLRKKIAGAIKCCEADAGNLVRPGK